MLYESKNLEKAWDGQRVRELRRQLGLSQQAMAKELGVRQQTISDWETGAYTPRGASSRVLSMVAEQAASYTTGATGAAQDERTGSSGRRTATRQRTANSPERRSRPDGQRREGAR